MSGRVIKNNDVLVDNDLDGTEVFAVPSFGDERFRSMAMAPMHARGKIIGILSIMSYEPGRFSDDVVSVLSVIADTIGVAVSNARLYEASVEQENRLSAVLHSTADGIIATDKSGTISLVNQTAERMLNIEGDDLIGHPLREARMPASMRKSLLAAVASPSQEAFEFMLENDRVISAVVSPVYVESQVEHTNSTDGWVIVLQDVTHLREAEIARAEFIQAAAHDMRNPLSLTLSSLTLLNSMIEEKDETVQEILDLALGGVNRLQGLIDDLLHLEHIENGYNLDLEFVSLAEILNEVAKETNPIMKDRHMVFSSEIPDELPLTQVDITWLKRALHNYLENATKYTPEGGKIILRARYDESAICIEVKDNGPGIPAKAKPHLFERFYRVEGVEGIRGSGLGLAIVKSVAEAHGGEPYVNSTVGEGSTFGIKLPIRSHDALDDA